MRKRLSVLLAVVVLGSALGGCSKCGFWWQESSRVCKDDVAPR